ncbi:uncharacterized protein ISCGN_016147 [Ixodes scapularis]
MATTLSPSIFCVQVTLCVLTHHVPTPPKNEVSILNPPAVSINCAHPGAHHETSPTHHGLKTAPPVEAYKEDRAMEFLRGHGGTAMATTLSPSIFFVQVTLCVLTHHVPTPPKNEVSILNPPAVSINCAHPGAHHETSPTHHGLKTAPPVEAYKEDRAMEFLRGHGGTAMATTLSPSIFFVQVTLCVLTHHVPTPPKNEVSILNPPAVSINCAHPGAHHETSPTHHGLKTAPPVEAYKEDRAMEFLRGHGGTAMATTLSPSIFFVQVTLCVLTHHVPTPPKNEVSILNPPAVSINCAHPGAHHETSPTHHGLKTAPPVEAYKEDRAMEFLRGHGGTAMATTLSPSIFFVQALRNQPEAALDEPMDESGPKSKDDRPSSSSESLPSTSCGNTGGTCESRCLEGGVSTDPEPRGFARPRMAVRGFPVSGEKGILVVEPSPG